jgi:superfamily II DNA or RNA helicase
LTGRSTERRFFTGSERAALYLAADGKCTSCGIRLEPGWHADHVQPWSAHGATDVINGQALCPSCNLTKGVKVSQPLRVWQQDALRTFAKDPEDFLLVATPGAGKTTFALTLAEQHLAGDFARIVVVVPTLHLRRQWAVAAAKFGIKLDHVFTNGISVLATDVDGAVTTYASVAASPLIWRKISAVDTLVILDEVHHAGESDHLIWGEALKTAFSEARRRLLLSGTIGRTDGRPVPFVKYESDGRPIRSYNYDYGQAIRDGSVVRPIEFLALNGQARWTNAGSGVASTTSLEEADTPDALSKALQAVLDADNDWIPSVLKQADAELTKKRLDMPDAGGLVVASDQAAAVEYATKLEHITGTRPVVAISDNAKASEEITTFARGEQRWLVAVKMVSEGVDIPRLAVGVYATNTRSLMFVHQLVGRFVRKRGDVDESAATLFIPSIKPLMTIVAAIERTVDAELIKGIEERDAASKESGLPRLFDVIDTAATEAVRLSVISGNIVYEDAELRHAEEIALKAQQAGLSKNWSAAQVALILRIEGRGVPQVAGHIEIMPSIEQQQAPVADQKASRRAVITRKVNRLANTTGREQQSIHAELNRRCGGLKVSQATIEQLNERIRLLNAWLGFVDDES